MRQRCSGAAWSSWGEVVKRRVEAAPGVEGVAASQVDAARVRLSRLVLHKRSWLWQDSLAGSICAPPEVDYSKKGSGAQQSWGVSWTRSVVAVCQLAAANSTESAVTAGSGTREGGGGRESNSRVASSH